MIAMLDVSFTATHTGGGGGDLVVVDSLTGCSETTAGRWGSMSSRSCGQLSASGMCGTCVCVCVFVCACVCAVVDVVCVQWWGLCHVLTDW